MKGERLKLGSQQEIHILKSIEPIVEENRINIAEEIYAKIVEQITNIFGYRNPVYSIYESYRFMMTSSL